MAVRPIRGELVEFNVPIIELRDGVDVRGDTSVSEVWELVE
jgi:hypothetical protein